MKIIFLAAALLKTHLNEFLFRWVFIIRIIYLSIQQNGTNGQRLFQRKRIFS